MSRKTLVHFAIAGAIGLIIRQIELNRLRGVVTRNSDLPMELFDTGRLLPFG